jgi:hypothetical protein
VDVVLPKVALLEVDLTYPKHPIKILNQKDRVTRCKIIKFFKVQWSNHLEEEATWEKEDFLHFCHPEFKLRREKMCDCLLFLLGHFSLFKSRLEISFKGVGCDNPSAL